MQSSNIEWTNQTWNPITGCTKISPGCKNCYAANIAETRFKGAAAFPHGFELVLHPDRLAQVSFRQKPKMIFVNSMSDIFHEEVPEAYIRRISDVMMAAHQHTYQILTKRHKRMHSLLSSPAFLDVAEANHIWWGVSAEDRKYGWPRVETLIQTPVRNRFVSFEPLLEDIGEIDLNGLGWIIIGGESGPGARSFDLEWAESLVAQARRDRVPAFLKQIGARPMLGGKSIINPKGDPKGHQMSSLPGHLRVREFPSGMRLVATDNALHNRKHTPTTAPSNVVPLSAIGGATKSSAKDDHATKKEKLHVEKIAVRSEIEWDHAKRGLLELKSLLDAEISALSSTAEIRNAYSPITWIKLCQYIRHATEGMTAVRQSTEGKSAKEISAATGMSTSRIAAFKAWNTMWRGEIRKIIELKWRKAEERRADIQFLRSIGIAVAESEWTGGAA